jgi:ATP-dependent Clp protease adapter protein ClpS
LMSTLLVLLFLSTSASGFTIVPTPTNAVRLQTFAPVREPGTTRDFAPTLPRPETLPETWVVPDTFTFPTKKTKEPNLYRLTLFKSSKHKAEYIVAALIETIGIEATKANEIAKQAQTLGFAVVGDYVQEVAETYAATLKERYDLVVDVSVVR